MEELGAIPGGGDNQTIYDKISPSLVKLVFKAGELEFMIPGIIAMSGDDYCYIIAFSSPDLQSMLSEVILPDGTMIKLKKQDLETRYDLLAFFVKTSGRMKSVDFGEHVSINEEVFSFVFDNKVVLPLCHMSPGRVTCERKFEFSHDSSSGTLTPYGGLVFNKKAEFVGMSYKDRGVIIAHKVQYISGILGFIHPKMMGKPLSEILQHIEAKSRKNRKRVNQAQSKKKTDGQAKSPEKRKKKSR